MKTITALVLVAFASSAAPSHAQSRAEEVLFGQLTSKGTNSITALDRVLKAPEDFSAVILFSAAAVALGEKKLEDAGFLFYSAQLRKQFDKALFPPSGTGGNNPLLAIGAIQQAVGQQVNPAIIAEPKVYSKAIERVKAWKPRVTANYEPGWEYSKKKNVKQVEEAVAADRKDFIDHMSDFGALLQDPNYFAAFRICQDYNLKLDGTRPSERAYNEALQTMEKIEKEKKIEGFASVTKR